MGLLVHGLERRLPGLALVLVQLVRVLGGDGDVDLGLGFPLGLAEVGIDDQILAVLADVVAVPVGASLLRCIAVRGLSEHRP